MRISVRSSSLAITFLIIAGLFATVLFSASQTSAAPESRLSVTCTQTSVSGRVSKTVPYVLIQVTRASNLTQVVATKVVKPNRHGDFSAQLHYARLPQNTLLVISVGEWDGQAYLNPATLQSRACNAQGGTAPATSTPTPIIDFTPTLIPTLTPTSVYAG